MTNRSMPPGIIIHELAFPDVETAADWLCSVMGFNKRLTIGKHRIQLVLDGSSLVATATPNGEVAGKADHAIMVRVPVVDEHYRNAHQLGAKILQPPADYSYGERQ